MITSLSLYSFKAWRELVDVRIAPLTGLFGINSAGKSSLIQLLLLLKQTAESPDRALVLHLGDERSLVELGTFADVTHGHNPESGTEWSVAWELPELLRVEDVDRPGQALLRGRSLRFDARVIANGQSRMALDRFEYEFAEHRFGVTRIPGKVPVCPAKLCSTCR